MYACVVNWHIQHLLRSLQILLRVVHRRGHGEEGHLVAVVRALPAFGQLGGHVGHGLVEARVAEEVAQRAREALTGKKLELLWTTNEQIRFYQRK